MDVIITRRKTLFRGRDHCQIVLQSPGEKLLGKKYFPYENLRGKVHRAGDLRTQSGVMSDYPSTFP